MYIFTTIPLICIFQLELRRDIKTSLTSRRGHQLKDTSSKTQEIQ
jgi:hypothetical protein